MNHSLPRINDARIIKFTKHVASIQVGEPLNFYSFRGKDGAEIVASDMYPNVGEPHALDFFFFTLTQNWGFWHLANNAYDGPLYGTLNGKPNVKGSDLLWMLLKKEYDRDASTFSPSRVAHLTGEELARIFSDDNGPVKLLASAERLAVALQYANWFAKPRICGATPADIVAYARASATPAQTFLDILTDPVNGIPGFNEDPLQKKATLLLMVLVNRPEQFIKLESSFEWPPIVDYHLMRLALRLGLVVLPDEWAIENVGRRATSPEREAAIRSLTYIVIGQVAQLSRRLMPVLDLIMWSARRYCPEVETPNCAKCSLAAACAKKTELFQPILRTQSY